MFDTIIHHKLVIPLSMATKNEIKELVDIRSGKELKSYLSSLGFTIGAKMEVLQNACQSSFIVKIKESRIILGRGMAQKIMGR